MNRDTKILFVCSGNINRSPAARHLYFKNGFVNVDSCGLGLTAAKNLPMTKKMKAALEEDVVHTSKKIDQNLVDWADVIICMGPGQVKKVNKLYNTDKARLFYHGKIEDPHFTGRYKEVVEQIKHNILVDL